MFGCLLPFPGVLRAGIDLDEARRKREDNIVQLRKDKRDENIAMAGLENDFNYKVADLDLRRSQSDKSQELEQLRLSLAGKQLEVSIATSLAELDLRQQTLDETIAQNIITNSQKTLSEQPAFVKYAVPLGLASVGEGGKITWTDEGQKWLKENSNLILRSSLTSSKSSKTGPLAPEQDRFVLDSLSSEASLEQARYDLAAQGIKNPSTQDLENYFIRQYQRVQAGGGQPQAQAGGGQQLIVGQVVSQGGRKFRVTGFDEDGNPDTEEIK